MGDESIFVNHTTPPSLSPAGSASGSAAGGNTMLITAREEGGRGDRSVHYDLGWCVRGGWREDG